MESSIKGGIVLSTFIKDVAGRIHYPLGHTLTFADLPALLEAFAYHLPFDNAAVLKKESVPFDQNRLRQTFIERQAGGVCYDLNHLLYEVLRIKGFDVSLLKATVFDQENDVWSATGPTHVAVLLSHQEQTYLVDMGFGVNLALRPIPLTGETITSPSGNYRIAPNGAGYQLEMLRTGQDDEFVIGYHFYTQQTIEPAALSDMEQIIQEHPASPFNKRSLLAIRMADGHRILTRQALTTWTDGKKTIQPVTSDDQYAAFKHDFF